MRTEPTLLLIGFLCSIDCIYLSEDSFGLEMGSVCS